MSVSNRAESPEYRSTDGANASDYMHVMQHGTFPLPASKASPGKYSTNQDSLQVLVPNFVAEKEYNLPQGSRARACQEKHLLLQSADAMHPRQHT